MKRVFFGLVLGFILATTTSSIAQEEIKLIVNGKKIQCDVSPQIINGRVMVPAKFIAEPLGAKVEWDSVNNVIIINSLSASNNSLKVTYESITTKNTPDNLTEWWPPKKINVKGAKVQSEYYSWYIKDNDLFISSRLAYDILYDKGYYLDKNGYIYLKKPETKPIKHINFIENNKIQAISIKQINQTGLINLSWDIKTQTIFVK